MASIHRRETVAVCQTLVIKTTNSASCSLRVTLESCITFALSKGAVTISNCSIAVTVRRACAPYLAQDTLVISGTALETGNALAYVRHTVTVGHDTKTVMRMTTGFANSSWCASCVLIFYIEAFFAKANALVTNAIVNCLITIHIQCTGIVVDFAKGATSVVMVVISGWACALP